MKGKKAVLAADGAEEQVACDDLVVVAEFGEPIYPGLRRLGSIDRGGDKPAHVVIKGENYHALEALRFSHAGKVDCIYIDPPYNTGARDWKYDNDYVDADDGYRHSKWLAFMERRLRLARDLLNPDDSALICTIAEDEVHRLGLLIEQIFATANVQMASIVINPSGAGGFGLNRVEEHAFFVWLGAASPARWTDDLLTDGADDSNARVRGGLSWESLLRSGRRWYRAERPNLCYPVKIDPETMEIAGTGSPFSGADESDRAVEIDGLPVAWPVRRNGRLGVWRVEPPTLMSLVERGYAYASSYDAGRRTYSLKYLLEGTIELIESGDVSVTRTGHRGQVEAAELSLIGKAAKTVWYRSSHNAGKHGSDLIESLVPGSDFDYPKSLYAVEDAVRLAVFRKPEAVVLDFFAGSGTTGHAVMRLNRQDGGARSSIQVTNNEVSAQDAERLSGAGYLPGDPEWERNGIFERITRPRMSAAATGSRADGQAVSGDYKFIDEFPIAEGLEENVEFLELRYLDIEDVELDLVFEAVAPLLWLRAGGAGPVIDRRCDDAGTPKTLDVTDHYGVLFDPDHWRAFVEKLPESVKTVFVVTDSASVFASVAAELPSGVDVVRLYENYLSTFAINRGR
jgi:adenine-specific DNA-methyltransferase